MVPSKQPNTYFPLLRNSLATVTSPGLEMNWMDAPPASPKIWGIKAIFFIAFFFVVRVSKIWRYASAVCQYKFLIISIKELDIQQAGRLSSAHRFKMRMVIAPSQSHSQEVGIGVFSPSASYGLFNNATPRHWRTK